VIGVTVCDMTHNRYVGFIDEHNRGYLVAFTLHWEVIEARRVDPAVGAPRALRAFINEYEANGWLAESDANYGFIFMNRDPRRPGRTHPPLAGSNSPTVAAG
jgi:hypothetical protein